MRALGLVGLAALLMTGCAGGLATAPGATPTAGATPKPTVSPTPVQVKGGSPSPVPGVPSPSARCVAKPTGAPMVLMAQALYEVGDPVHPKLLCKITNTVAHLYTADTFAYLRRTGDTGTEVVLHSIGSGNESVIAGWPLAMLNQPFEGAGAWTIDGNTAATAVSATDVDGNPTIQIWLFTQPTTAMLYEFDQPLTDCICRFGLPSPTLKFSPDGQYLVSGWPIGKGAMPLRVYHVADRTLVQTLGPGEATAFWDRSGHRLYVTGIGGSARSWTPEAGLASLGGSTSWPFEVGLSPDGSEIAYTAYQNPSMFSDLRVYVYDFANQKTRALTSQMRSEVHFVRDGWVWYEEEAQCDPTQPTCAPWGTAPTGKVFAMNLSVGVETQVVFAPGESPAEQQSGFGPGEFWPNT